MPDHLTTVTVRWKVVHASPRGVRHPGDIEDVDVETARRLLAAGAVELDADGIGHAVGWPEETPEKPKRGRRTST